MHTAHDDPRFSLKLLSQPPHYGNKNVYCSVARSCLAAFVHIFALKMCRVCNSHINHMQQLLTIPVLLPAVNNLLILVSYQSIFMKTAGSFLKFVSYSLELGHYVITQFSLLSQEWICTYRV